MAGIVHIATSYIAVALYMLAVLSGFKAMRVMADEADFKFSAVMAILLDYFESLILSRKEWVSGSRARHGHIAWMALGFGLMASTIDLFLLFDNKILTDNALTQGMWVSTLWNAGHIAAALGLLFLHIRLHAQYSRKG